VQLLLAKSHTLAEARCGIACNAQQQALRLLGVAQWSRYRRPTVRGERAGAGAGEECAQQRVGKLGSEAGGWQYNGSISAAAAATAGSQRLGCPRRRHDDYS